MSTESNFGGLHRRWNRSYGSQDGRITTASHPELPDWLREQYPFRTRTLELADERMSFVDEGPASAPPLVLLHDSPGWSFEFRKLISIASGHYRVIAPDLVGFGLSSKPVGGRYCGLAQHSEHVAQLIEGLDLRNVTLLLHGWGGPIGMAYAVGHAENLRHIVLTNTWAMPLPHATNIKLPLGVRIALGRGLGRMLDSWLKLSITSGISAAAPLPGLTVEGYKYPYEHGESCSGVRAFWRMLWRPDEDTVRFLAQVAAALPKIEAPVDIVWGRKDHILGKLPAYLLRDRFRHSAEITFLEDASHFVVEDAPEALAEKL